MNTDLDRKIKKLLAAHRSGVPFLSKWLIQKGISQDLQQYYARSGWLESLGYGAYRRFGDTPTWLGGIFALQEEAGYKVHVGGLTALSLLGREHYLRFNREASYTFSYSLRKLPAWFVKYKWETETRHTFSKFLPDDLALTTHNEGNFEVRISSLERAMLECLYLAPKYISYVECYQIFEGLVNLRPEVLQRLLEACSSVRVKRVFLFMSDKAHHGWRSFLETSHVDLGTGVRSLEKRGIYVAEFELMVPRDLFDL